MDNPLLSFTSPPDFDAIELEHILPALEQVLSDARQRVVELEKVKEPSWMNFVAPLEQLSDSINRVWSPISHLNAVQDSQDLRQLYQTCIEQLTLYSSEIGQNLHLYQQFKRLHQSEIFVELTKGQQKVVLNSLLDFKLSGAELGEDDQQELKKIDLRLSELSNQFDQNVLDATQSWSFLVTSEQDLDGMPTNKRQLAKQLAEQEGQQGWLLNLQIPSYLSVMQHVKNTNLRKKVYQAYVKRASELSDDGKYDNRELIEEILQLRQQKAQLLDYANYVEYSLAKKMADNSDQVFDFLNQLLEKAKPMAQKELLELRGFAKQEYQIETLEPWDIAYYSERLKEKKYAISDEQIRQYFPLDRVVSGMFEIVKTLFDVDIVPNHLLSTWHEDVLCFDVIKQGSTTTVGQFYMDLFARENKKGGAWMSDCINRHKTEQGVQTPVAFLTCNFTPANKSVDNQQQPALLSHSEVETLLHEFGHALHHLLTQVDEFSVSGINGVAWDAVELPSQLLENWCWHEQGLSLLTQHYQTLQGLPVELLNKMRAGKNFQSAMQTLRQLEFALFDLSIHVKHDATSIDVQKELDAVREKVSVLHAPPYHRFQNSFSHIFAGGYAAGYYSYKWAEVLSADVFSLFEEQGVLNPNTGKLFLQSILSKGGVYDMAECFKQFRGRAPNIDALLRHTGLVQQT